MATSNSPAPSEIIVQINLDNVDWGQLKAMLAVDRFDNGRTAEQLRASFENSFACVLAKLDGRVVGTARALSDGVCNAYIVDVWTHSELRNQGIGRKMMELLLARLNGQHVYLFTDDTVDFYKKLGFGEQPVGLSLVVGKWLEP